VSDHLTAAEVAEQLDLSAVIVTAMCRSGELPAVKKGRSWQIPVEGFEAWLRERHDETVAWVARNPPRADASSDAWLESERARAAVTVRWQGSR
jgi:excisionase family DNA binding protein